MFIIVFTQNLNWNGSFPSTSSKIFPALTVYFCQHLLNTGYVPGTVLDFWTCFFILSDGKLIESRRKHNGEQKRERRKQGYFNAICTGVELKSCRMESLYFFNSYYMVTKLFPDLIFPLMDLNMLIFFKVPSSFVAHACTYANEDLWGFFL